VDPTNASEFASLAAIFDEYTADAFEMVFTNSCVAQTPGAATLITGQMFGFSYDPTTSAVLTSMSEVFEAETHKVYALSQNTNYPTIVSTYVEFKPLTFSGKIPPGTIADESAGVNVSVGASQWQSTLAGSTRSPYGFIKPIVTAQAISVNLVQGILYYFAKFRIRI